MMGWVVLRPNSEVFDKETGYERGGRRGQPCWWQTAARKQLIDTVARDWCCKSGRCGGIGGDRDGAESEDGAENDGSRYSGQKIGDAQVGK